MPAVLSRQVRQVDDRLTRGVRAAIAGAAHGLTVFVSHPVEAVPLAGFGTVYYPLLLRWGPLSRRSGEELGEHVIRG